MNHVSVSPTDGTGPTQGQRKTLTRVGIACSRLTQSVERRRSNSKVVGSIPTVGIVFLCPCVGPLPSVGLTLTWFIWDRNLALYVTLHSLQLTLFKIYVLHGQRLYKRTLLYYYEIYMGHSFVIGCFTRFRAKTN